MACRLKYHRMLVPVLALTALSGCGYGTFEWNYVFSAAGGELRLLAAAVPIEEGLNDPNLTDEQKEKLRVVIDTRDYAANVIGLNVGSNYQTFADLDGQPLAWNLSASPKDKIEAYVWNLPVAGTTPFLGFFSLDEAYQERDALVAEGYDTLIYELDAYSTVGVVPDPVASPMLERATYSLVDTVFHELTHNTIYTDRDTVFDESLASFVGRTAAMQYLTERYGADSDVTAQAVESYEDADIFNAFLTDLRERLDAVYNSDMSTEDKIAARVPIFDAARQRMTDEILPAMHQPARYETYATFNYNNAFILVNVRYNTNFDLFNAVFEKTGRDWARTLSIFSQAAAADDPFAFLSQQLAP